MIAEGRPLTEGERLRKKIFLESWRGLSFLKKLVRGRSQGPFS